MATKVIDVSVHQGTINWDLVKSQQQRLLPGLVHQHLDL